MLLAAVIIAGYVNRDRIRLKIASVYASVPPKAAQSSSPTRSRNPHVYLVAPWALSVLPECLEQTREVTGPRAYVLARFPAGYRLQPAGTELSYADCEIDVTSGGITIRRGGDRLRVSPGAELYRRGQALALLRESDDRAELRLYVPSTLGR